MVGVTLKAADVNPVLKAVVSTQQPTPAIQVLYCTYKIKFTDSSSGAKILDLLIIVSSLLNCFKTGQISILRPLFQVQQLVETLFNGEFWEF